MEQIGDFFTEASLYLPCVLPRLCLCLSSSAGLETSFLPLGLLTCFLCELPPLLFRGRHFFLRFVTPPTAYHALHPISVRSRSTGAQSCDDPALCDYHISVSQGRHTLCHICLCIFSKCLCTFSNSLFDFAMCTYMCQAQCVMSAALFHHRLPLASFCISHIPHVSLLPSPFCAAHDVQPFLVTLHILNLSEQLTFFLCCSAPISAVTYHGGCTISC